MRRLGLILFTILLFTIVQPQAQAPNPIVLTVEGPTALNPGQIGAYYVNVTGGPAEDDGNYTVKYWVEAANTEGASPLKANRKQETIQNNTIILNITVPTTEGDAEIVFEVTSQNNTANQTVKRTVSVKVLAPLVLTASFENTGGAASLNITVRFYIDDLLVGSDVIHRIDPGNRGTATINWLPVGLNPGEHRVRIEADLDNNGQIESSKGEVVAYDIFYKTGEELAPGYLIILSISIAIIGLIIVFAIRRRRKMR